MGYEIQDDGTGFTDQNLAFFGRSDTTHKPGGKGVGRLLWLHVFDRAEIDSIFTQDSKRWHRKFSFSREKEGIDEVESARVPYEGKEPNRTIVKLLSPKADRLKVLPQDSRTLANQLLEHFLLYFTAFHGQSLTVVDVATGDSVNVGDLYTEVIGDRHSEETFEIRSHAFTIHHVLVRPSTDRKNVINLCADRRVVTTEAVNDWIPEVTKSNPVRVQDSLRYHAYVTGNYLDENVDDERTGLKFTLETITPDDEEDGNIWEAIGLEPPDIEGVTKKEVFAEITNRIKAYLEECINGVKTKKAKQLESFATSEQPQFRPYLERAKNHLDRLKTRPTKKDIELALYEAKIDGRNDMNKLVKEIIDGSEVHQQVNSVQRALIENFTQEANNANVSALADFVCTRRAVLTVFHANLGSIGDRPADYSYEEILHNLFFPRFRTSDEVSPGYSSILTHNVSNLWLLDERLVFHSLLTSDLPNSKLQGFLSDSEDRADVVIFDPAFAATNDHAGLGEIAIIEFKRPSRDDYGPGKKKNPIDQVISLANDIRSGKIVDINGVKRTVPASVRIYAYIICDVTPSLEEILNERSFRNTPDMQGWYFPHEKLAMTIEVIPYEKLITDATRRNEAFFKILGLPDPTQRQRG